MPAKTWDEVYGAGAQQAHGTYPCAACGYAGPVKTDLNSPTALKGLAIEVLVQIIETAPRNVSLVAAIRELIDRVEGKAPQSINLDLKDTRMDRMPIDELIYLASLKREPLLIAEMPKVIDNNE